MEELCLHPAMAGAVPLIIIAIALIRNCVPDHWAADKRLAPVIALAMGFLYATLAIKEPLAILVNGFLAAAMATGVYSSVKAMMGR